MKGLCQPSPKEMATPCYPCSVGPFRFPEDEGSHPGYAEEWWYLKVHFATEGGQRYAFMVSYINQGYRVSALVDLDRRAHHRFSYPPEAGPLSTTEGCHALTQGNSWWVHGEKAFHYRLHEEMATKEARFGSLDLELSPHKPPVPVGGGIVKMGRNGSTYWYALTRLHAKGRIALGSGERSLEGVGWLDRQWGSWNWMGFQGWKWFAVDLDDGREVAAFQISEPVSLRPMVSICQLIAQDGSCQIASDLRVRNLGSWHSPSTGEVYTCGWRIDSRGLDLQLEILPALAAQEVHRGLWEGSCTARGVVGGQRASGPTLVELNTGRLAPTAIRYLSYLKAIGSGAWDRIKRGSSP